MDTVRAGALAALVPVSVLLCLPELSTFQLGKAVLVGPMVAALLVATRRSAGRAAAPVLATTIVVVLVGGLALLRSPSPGVGAWELWLDLLLLGSIILGARLGSPRPFFIGVALAGAALVGVTGLEAAGIGPICPAAVADAGTMGNPNFTGAVLALAAPAGLALALGTGRLWLRLAWSGLVLACLSATIALGSWTGAVGAVVGLFAGGIHAMIRRGAVRMAAALGLLLVLVIGGALASPTVRGHLADRLYMARVSGAAGMEAPIGGHGLGGFPRAFLDAQAAVLEDSVDERGRWTRALHAHAEPLHAFVERGAPGLLAWLALWIAIAWAVLRRYGAPGVTGVLAAGLALSLGEFPQHLVPVQLALGLAAGGASAPNVGGPSGPDSSRDGPPTGPPTGRAPRWTRQLVWLLAVPLFLVPPWLALSDREVTRGDPAQALAINPWNGRAAFAVALVEQEGLAPTGCAHARLADRLLPSPASAMTLGLCAARTGRLDEGIVALRQAASWNPRSATAHANLALLLLEAGDLPGAARHATRAASLRPGDPRIRAVRDAIPRAGVE